MRDPGTLTFYELLSYSTTRIECDLHGGGKSTGTGFFLYLNNSENESEMERIVLVTNKHVIKNAAKGYLTLTKMVDGKIHATEHVPIPFSNFAEAWVPHPDDSIDLCILNFKPIETLLRGNKREYFYMPLLFKFIPSVDESKKFDVVEEVIMIGYPNGIWDKYNNKPIFRRGITATDYKLNYNNREEFLVDIAVFNGSSGSPVLIANNGIYSLGGEPHSGSRIHLLGILHAGFQHTFQGEIKVVEIPHIQKPIVTASIPNNLGLVIRAEKLIEFRNLFYS